MLIPEGGTAGGPREHAEQPRRFMTVDEVVSALLDAQVRQNAASDWVGAPLSRCQMLRALVVRGALCRCSPFKEPAVELPATSGARRRRLVEVDRFVVDVLDEQIEKHELSGVRTRMRRWQMMRRLVFRAVRCTCPVE